MVPTSMGKLQGSYALEHAPSRSRISYARLPLLIAWPLLTALAYPEDQAHTYVQYAIGALLLVQIVLIVALLIQNRRRRHAERDAERLQAEMTHAARLALAGEITASIAHEVTQPLSAILSNVETAQLLLTQQSGNSAINDILSDIKRDDLRANEIVRHLRTLLRKRELCFEPTDLNSLVANALTLVRTDATRRSIVLRTELASELPPVSADPVHSQQVLLNLLLNAMDAMASTPPTRRRLEVKTRVFNHASIEIAVMDSGRGMTTEELARAFESFFTTKAGGMGLGLSIARTIVRAHGGKIWAESRQNDGTTFHVTFPVVSDTNVHPQLSAAPGR